MMTEGLSDAWVCHKCSYENQDYQRCMGPGCDEVRPGSIFDTSEFALSTQPPSSGRRSTINVAMNHPAATARRPKKPLPPQRESPGRGCKTNATARITEMCSVGGRLLPRPRPPRLPPRSRPPRREYTSTPPLAPRKSAVVDETPAAVDELIAVTAAGEDGSRHDHGGGEAVATRG